MITRLRVRGFKSLLDVDVAFGPLTVLVGTNGSGKTSVLEAIKFLRDAVLRPVNIGASSRSLYKGRFSRLLSRQGSEPIVMESSILAEGETMALTGEFRHDTFELTCTEGAREHTKRVTNRLADAVAAWERDATPVTDPALWDELSSETKLAAEGIELHRLDAEAMAKATYSDDTEPVLAVDGRNLAAVLDALQGMARERFDEIERRLRELVPQLTRVRVRRARTLKRPQAENEVPTSVIGHQVVFDFEHAPDISAEDAGEGTLLLLGLLTIIESKPRGDVTILFDDLERALHPKAQRQLVGYLRDLVRSRPGLQIIATSHAPYLVDHLDYEEVRVVAQAADGTVKVAPLLDHPEAESCREEEMSAGEFWSSVGEGWVAAEPE
jgi:predicted ATPase